MTKRFVILFVILNLFLSIFHLDTWQNGNTTSRAIAVVAFAESHSLQIDKRQEESVDKIFVNGHYYSDKAPLPLFLVIPFFELVNMFGISPDNMERTAYIVGDVLCGSIPFTFIILISFLFIRKINDSKISPVLLSMLPFYASFIFIYSGTFYSHLLSALFLLMAYVSLRFKKEFFLSGLLCGLSLASEFPIALVIAIWSVQIFINEKSLKPVLKFAFGIFPALLFLGAYNYFLTGSIFNMSYKYHAMQALHTDYGFSLPKPEALWGLTLSPYRGVFVYAPFLFMFLFFLLKTAMKKSWKELFSFIISDYLMIISLASVIFMSGYFEWWGGWCYGPRLIFFIAVLLCFEGIRFFASHYFFKRMFWLLISFGIVCTFMAKSTIVYSVPTEIKNPIKDQVISNFMNNNFNPNNILTMLFDIAPKTANYIWLICFVIILISLTVLYKKEKNLTDAKQILESSC